MSAPSARMSVVIPTYNRRHRLARVLTSLARQDVDEPFEVVVVSDGSTDDTDEYLASAAVPLRVVSLTQPNQGPAVARNTGVGAATGELVVFVDDDVVADPGLLRAHRDAHLARGDRVVVIGPMLDPPDHTMSPWVAWEQRMLAKQYTAMLAGEYSATCRQFYTGNASVRAEHIRAAGGFDPAFRRAEDIELAFRLDDLGLEFHFEPAAIGLHYAERSYDAWRETAYAYGRNDIVFARDLGRDWMYGFVQRGFAAHHPAVRALATRSITSARWRSSALRVLEPLARRTRNAVPERVAQHALSGVYAIEYHRGIADELGSVAAFDRLMRTGEPA